jgi:hypothetical protein
LRDDGLKLFSDPVTLERDRALAIDEHRCYGRFTGAGQTNTHIGKL